MEKKKKHLLDLLHGLMLSVMAVMIFGSLGYINPGPQTESVRYITDVSVQIDDGPVQQITLPYRFGNLPPRTSVTATAVIYPNPGDELYVRSKYCPGKVYLDDTLGYEFGKPGQFPPFMTDPAAEIHMIETHGTGEAMQLQLQMQSPHSQNWMVLEPPIVGSTKAIILTRFHAYGILCVMAAAQVIYGLSLLFISVCTQFIDKKGVSFLWLGLLSLTTGIWALGENLFSGMVFKNAVFLHLCSFAGFFTFIIPLLRFSRTIVDYENPRPLILAEHLMVLSAAAAMILQLLTLVQCTTSMHYFYVVLPLCMVFIAVYTIREAFLHHNVSAKRYILPITLLSLASVAGLIFYVFSINYMVASMTQLGIVVFLLLVGVTAGLSIKDSLELKNKRKELDFQKQLMDIQVKEQKTHSLLLDQHEQLLSQQRHDLRHHLNAILALANPANTQLTDYLHTLVDNIPQSQKVFCENKAVNAILAHYDALCAQKGISLELHVGISETNPSLSDSALCIIFGNLLENAVEACERMNGGRRFITLHTRQQYDLLTITMDNSFNGSIRMENGRFRSSKRDNFGIGLHSIRDVAQHAGGDAEFHGEDQVFLSSVFVKL